MNERIVNRIAVLAIVLALAGCATPAASSLPSEHAPGTAHLPTSAAPSASASVDPLAACIGVEPEGEPLEVEVGTVSYAFDPSTIEGPRHCQPFVIVFTNSDTGGTTIPNFHHDVDIRLENVLGQRVFDGETIANTTIRYEVPGLPAGEHYFYCSIHAGMSGLVLVAP
jgi:hypothetical protein